MWNVGNLVEGLVLSSNFDGDVAVYQVIALCLAIFYCMTYRELIHGETFPQSAYVLLTTKGAEHVGVVDINLVRLLQNDIDQFVRSTSEKVVDKLTLKQELVDKWSVKPSLAEKLVDIMEFVADKDQITTEEIVSHFGFNPTTAKRYLRQLTEFGYLEAHGGNKNRTYTKK